MSGYFVLQVLVGRGGTHILYQQTGGAFRADLPFSTKGEAIELARGMYDGIQHNAPAEDFYVVDGGGNVVWKHPKNKQNFTGRANMAHLI